MTRARAGSPKGDPLTLAEAVATLCDVELALGVGPLAIRTDRLQVISAVQPGPGPHGEGSAQVVAP